MQYGKIRPFATGAIQLSLTGPGEIVGENPFSLSGGAGAVWVRSKEAAGVIRLEARHQYLGKQTVEIRVRRAERGVRLTGNAVPAASACQPKS